MKSTMHKKIYFGHPVNTYNTELEIRLLAIISKAFPDYNIENPNQKHHQNGYKHWKKTTGNGMNYFFKKVLPDCQAGIFLPFRDEKWGAGVFGEAKALIEREHSIWKITADGIITEVSLTKIQALSIKETISRIRTASGESISY